MPQTDNRPLFERFRPRSMSEFVGNPKAAAQIERIISTGAGGRAIWISGPSGTGKTTAARIIAESIADLQWGTVEVDAGQVSTETIREWSRDCHKYGWGKGGRAYIVNEAHGMRGATIRALLVWLEELPSHCTVIFTTTLAGEAKLFDDQQDTGPLLSRCQCVALTGQGLAEPFAQHIHRVAMEAGLNGCPDAEAVAMRIVRKCKGNLRAALQEVEAGAMMVNAD